MVNSTHCSLSCFLFAHCFYHSPWFRWRTGCIQIWAKYKYIYPSTFRNRNVNILLAESHHSVSNGKSRTAEWRLSSSAILIHATVDPNSTIRRLQISGCEFSAWWREPPRTPLSVDKIGTRNLRSLNIVVMPLSVMVFQTRTIHANYHRRAWNDLSFRPHSVLHGMEVYSWQKHWVGFHQ